VTLLWSPIWHTPPDFRVPRGYTDLVVVGWQSGSFVSIDNPIVLLEIPFGGYRFVVKFVPEFWDAGSGTWQLQDIFEDVYALAPGSDTPIDAGEVHLFWRWYVAPYFRSGIVLDMPAINPTYYFMDAPPLPEDYWQVNGTPLPERPFQYVP